MGFQCCVVTDNQTRQQHHELLDSLGCLEVTFIDSDDSPKNIKQQLLACSSLHVVFVIAPVFPRRLFSLLDMVRNKRHFACAYIGEELVKPCPVIDWHEPTSHLVHTTSIRNMLAFMAKSAEQQQKQFMIQDAKITLLSQLTKLTRSEISLDYCVDMISASLAQLCQTEFIGLFDKEDLCVTSHSALKQLTALPPSVKHAIDEQKVKVNFDENGADIIELNHHSYNIAGSLSFPIICNQRVEKVIHCYLDASVLNMITLDTISLVEQACHQLRIILERISAQEALEQNHNQLKQTLAELKTTKAHLYQSEKLAAIGELAAGIAHEINNPLAFVASNFQSLKSYIETMSEVLNEHSEFLSVLKNVNQTKVDFTPIDQLHTDSNVDFILEDIEYLVSDSTDGLSRIREIIDNLLSFSRKGSAEKHEYHIHEGITSTLKLLHPKLKNGITVNTEFSHQRPITCNPGLINQVFLNIIQNAADAAGENGVIDIRTHDTDTHLEIAITDNGHGISDEVKAKIFDPFYTTKAINKGTGLGLSISHNIIEQHGGNITVNSELGKYTEFVIALPFQAVTTESNTTITSITPVN